MPSTRASKSTRPTLAPKSIASRMAKAKEAPASEPGAESDDSDAEIALLTKRIIEGTTKRRNARRRQQEQSFRSQIAALQIEIDGAFDTKERNAPVKAKLMRLQALQNERKQIEDRIAEKGRELESALTAMEQEMVAVLDGRLAEFQGLELDSDEGSAAE